MGRTVPQDTQPHRSRNVGRHRNHSGHCWYCCCSTSRARSRRALSSAAGSRSRSGAVRAAKVLKSEHAANAEVLAPFEDEFRILRTLHHPHLPEVFDYGMTA